MGATPSGPPAGISASLAAAGAPVGTVEVSIGPQFLERFSEHLYSSPNKAFEELVANSWDAGAKVVYVGLSPNLGAEYAAVWILDDGGSIRLKASGTFGA